MRQTPIHSYGAAWPDLSPKLWDSIIVGGGPAGLSAALVLGRCRRSVLLFDDGHPRNLASRAVQGLLGHEGLSPAELRDRALRQLQPYSCVVIDSSRVVNATSIARGFAVETADGRKCSARKLLVATGVVDELPDIPGFRELYGAGVFVCPYCDGWEVRDQAIAVYGRGDDKGGGLALEMTQWSRDVVLCSDGPADLSVDCRDRLCRHGIPIREEKMLDLQIASRIPHQARFSIRFESGEPLQRNALFFNTGRHQSSDVAQRLGCDTYEVRGCTVDHLTQMTHVSGLYVAGDASRDVLQVSVAIAEGTKAAVAINASLLLEDLV